MTDLIISQLGVHRAGRAIIKPASLTLSPGRIVAVMGANGAGKSTLLRAIAGLIPATGTVHWGEEDLLRLPPRLRAQRVGYLPQQHDFAWPMTVRDMVALGGFAFGEAAAPSQGHIDQQLERLAIAALAAKRVDQLSGGEMALAALARVLVADTPLLLLDEPAAALDIGRQYQLLESIAALAAAGRTVLLALHDLALAVQFADQIIWLGDGELAAVTGTDAAVINDHAARWLGRKPRWSAPSAEQRPIPYFAR